MKNIVVTGASGGIGRSIVSKLIDKDCVVWAIDQDEESLCVLYSNNDNVHQIACDLTVEDDISEMIRSISEEGGIDGLVHCAGVSKFTPIHMIKQKQIDEVFKVHVNSAILLCSKLAKKKIANSGCSIVLFSSMAAHEGSSGNSVYAAAKSALEGFVRSSAHDFADRGIRINALIPGDVDTGMFRAFKAQLGEEKLMQREAKYPLGFGSGDNIADTVTFLLDDSSSWITGQCITIDGGHSVCRI